MSRQRTAAIGASLTTLFLAFAVYLLIFQVNPAADQNTTDIRSSQSKIRDQQNNIRKIICAQAQLTANAYRFRSIAPDGKIESIRHFLTRMQAQRRILRLSVTLNLKCPSTPGFPPFKRQVGRALQEINEILSHYTQEQREPVSIQTPSVEPPRLVPVSPEGGGIGDEGAPADLFPPGDLLPGTPLEPTPPGEAEPQSPSEPSAPVPVPTPPSDPPVAPEAPAVPSPGLPPLPLPPIELPPALPPIVKGVEVTVTVSAEPVTP